MLINAAGSLPGDLHKLWRARRPEQYHVEYGYSCMGYEIPAAIGVQLAAPDRAVCALVGDGTYLMMPTEIVTAVQEGLPVNVVIVQNHGYASIGGLSEAVGAERFGPPTASAARRPPSRRPAPGGPRRERGQPRHGGLRAQTVSELRTALAAARASPRATAVYVETDPARPGLPAEAWWGTYVYSGRSPAARAPAARAHEAARHRRPPPGCRRPCPVESAARTGEAREAGTRATRPGPSRPGNGPGSRREHPRVRWPVSSATSLPGPASCGCVPGRPYALPPHRPPASSGPT